MSVLRRRVLTLALMLALPCTAWAQYKWLDASGQVNYGDSPPRDARQIERVEPRLEPASATAGLPYELRRALENFPVTLYTTPSCQACQAARDMLRARGVPYAERTISSAEEADRARASGVGTAVPVLSVGRDWVREPDLAVWHRRLDEAGYPRSSMLPAGYQYPAPRPLLPPPPAADAVGAAAPTR